MRAFACVSLLVPCDLRDMLEQLDHVPKMSTMNSNMPNVSPMAAEVLTPGGRTKTD